MIQCVGLIFCKLTTWQNKTTSVVHCNAVLAESPRVITDKLQRVMNSAVRASSAALESSTAVCHDYCMMSSTGSMSPIEYGVSSQCSCINDSMELLRRTWWTVGRWQQTSLVGNICALPLSASWSYRATDWMVSVVGVLLLRTRRLGIRCLTANVTQSWVSTLSNVKLRHIFCGILTTKCTKRIRDFFEYAPILIYTLLTY